MNNADTCNLLKHLLELATRFEKSDDERLVLPPQAQPILSAARTEIDRLDSEEPEWVKIGVVGVDSGQLMVCDPCYLESEWKGEGEAGERLAPGFRHDASGKVFYCTCHGAAPNSAAIPFAHFEEKLPDFGGKTPNEMVASGEFQEMKGRDPSGEFSYKGACEATLADEQAGQLNFKLGRAGAGVAFSSGFGDGCYDVFARFMELEDWGRRVAEVRVVMIDEDEEEEYEES